MSKIWGTEFDFRFRLDTSPGVSKPRVDFFKMVPFSKNWPNLGKMGQILYLENHLSHEVGFGLVLFRICTFLFAFHIIYPCKMKGYGWIDTISWNQPMWRKVVKISISRTTCFMKLVLTKISSEYTLLCLFLIWYIHVHLNVLFEFGKNLASFLMKSVLTYTSVYTFINAWSSKIYEQEIGFQRGMNNSQITAQKLHQIL